MADEDRRVGINVEVDVSRIEWTGGPVNVPGHVEAEAQAEPTGPPQTGGAEGGGGHGRPSWLSPELWLTINLFSRNLARILRTITRIVHLISAGFLKLSAGVMVAVLAVGSLYSAMKLCQGAWNLFAQGAVWALKIAVKAIIAFAKFVYDSIKRAFEASYQVVVAFVQATVNALQTVCQHLQRFTTNAVQFFAETEQAIADTVTAMGQFGEVGLKTRGRLLDSVSDMAAGSRRSAKEISTAMWWVAAAGWERFEDVVSITRQSIVLSEATLEDLNTSTRTLMSTLISFGLTGRDAARAVDALAIATVKSPAAVADFEAALGYCGATAHQFGISLEETLAALEGMAATGVRGSIAGTRLLGVLLSIAKRTERANRVLAEFKQFDVNPERLNPMKVGIIGVIAELERLQAIMGPERMRNMIVRAFERRAAQGLLSLLTVGSQQLRQYQGDLSQTGFAAKMQADQLNTLAGAWAQLKNLWGVIYLQVLRAGLCPALRDAINAIRDFVVALSKVGVFRWFGAFLGGFIRALVAAFRDAAPTIIASVKSIIECINANAYRIGPFISSVASTIRNFIGALPSLVEDGLTKVLPAILDFVTTALPIFLRCITAIAQGLSNLVSTIGPIITNFVRENGGLLVAWFQGIFNAASAFLSALSPLLPLLRGFASLISSVLATILPLVYAALPTLISAFQSLASWLSDHLALAWLSLVDAVAKFLPYVPQILMGFAGLIAAVLSLGSSIVTQVSRNIPVIARMFYGVLRMFAAFWRGISKGITGAQGKITALVNAVGRSLPRAMGLVIEMARGFIAGLSLIARYAEMLTYHVFLLCAGFAGFLTLGLLLVGFLDLLVHVVYNVARAIAGLIDLFRVGSPTTKRVNESFKGIIGDLDNLLYGIDAAQAAVLNFPAAWKTAARAASTALGIIQGGLDEAEGDMLDFGKTTSRYVKPGETPSVVPPAFPRPPPPGTEPASFGFNPFSPTTPEGFQPFFPPPPPNQQNNIQISFSDVDEMLKWLRQFIEARMREWETAGRTGAPAPSSFGPGRKGTGPERPKKGAGGAGW